MSYEINCRRRLIEITLALVAALSIAPALPAQPATLVGRVLHGVSEQPVAGAIVELAAIGLATRTDALGRFRLSGVPAGEHQVAARAIGYDRWAGALRFSGGDSLEVDILLGTALTKLATLRITAAAPDRLTALTLRDFEERRRTGLGRYLTKDYFEANDDRSVGSLIAHRIAGLRHNMRSGMAESLFVSSRGRKCSPNYVLNGVPNTMFFIGMLQPSQILGVEFHTAATVPAQYNMTQSQPCGTFVIWTK